MGEKRHELCCNCGNETGKAGRADDSIYVQSYGPLCEKCYDDFRATVLAENEKPDLHASLAEAREALRELLFAVNEFDGALMGTMLSKNQALSWGRVGQKACAARTLLDANAREGKT